MHKAMHGTMMEREIPQGFLCWISQPPDKIQTVEEKLNWTVFTLHSLHQKTHKQTNKQNMLTYQSYRMCIRAKYDSSIKLHNILMLEASQYFSFSYKWVSLIWTKVISQNNINLKKTKQDIWVMMMSKMAAINSKHFILNQAENHYRHQEGHLKLNNYCNH